jgi:hypothetical protein
MTNYPEIKLPEKYLSLALQGVYKPTTYIIKAKDYFYSDGYDEQVSDDYIIQEFMQEEVISLVEYFMPDLKDVTMKSINYEYLKIMKAYGEHAVILMKADYGYLVTSTDSGANSYMVALVPITEEKFSKMRSSDNRLKGFSYETFINNIFRKMEAKLEKTLRKKFPPYLYKNIDNKLRKIS